MKKDLKAAIRFDRAHRLRKAYRTDAGFLRVPVNPTKAGILVYRDRDGNVRRELRHPDDVFDPESMKTLGGAPITTEEHPPGMLTIDNVAMYSKGHVVEELRRDGLLMDGELFIQDRKTASDVESERLKEVSPGYKCLIDETPGVWEGQRYDARQYSIRYNHLTILEAGRGRSGPDVAIRMDSGDDDVSVAFEVRHDADDVSERTKKAPGPQKDEAAPPQKEEERSDMKTKKIEVGGVSVEIEETAAELVTKAMGELQGRMDGLETVKTELEEKVTKLQAERDELKERTDAFEKEQAQKASEALKASIVAVAPELKEKMDGLSDDEARAALIAAKTKHDPSKWSEDPAYMRARFDAIMETISESKSRNEEARKTIARTTEEPAERADQDDYSASKARAEMMERNKKQFLDSQK